MLRTGRRAFIQESRDASRIWAIECRSLGKGSPGSIAKELDPLISPGTWAGTVKPLPMPTMRAWARTFHQVTVAARSSAGLGAPSSNADELCGFNSEAGIV
jgi:hypothetical protein